MTENKRFIYCFEGIEDKWETVEEYKYTPCTKDGFQDLCYMLNELNDENEQLKKDFDSVSHNWALMYSEAKNKVEELSKENKKLKSINNQLEDRLEKSGIGIALKMEDLND